MTRVEWIVVGIAGLVLAAAGVVISAGQARSAQKVMVVACMNNQNIMATAIHSATLENNWMNGEPIVVDKVTAFLRDGQLPQCHAGGQYIIAKVGEWPRCTVHGELKMGEPNTASHGAALPRRP